MRIWRGTGKRHWQMIGLALALALPLAPSSGHANLVVDGSLGNSPYTIAANITNDNVIVGDTSDGVLNQNGFANQVNQALTLGNFSLPPNPSYGTYNLNGGSLSAATEIVGDLGIGILNQTGGTNTVTNNLTLGNGQANFSSGSYTLSGTGSLWVGGNELIANGTSGSFSQDGGTHTVSGELRLGAMVGDGAYTLRSGTLQAASEIIGYISAGTFEQDSGTHTVTGDLTVGDSQPGKKGYYELNHGSLRAANEIIGGAGTGEFEQYGGTHTVTGNLTLGKEDSGKGTYLLDTGVLQTANEIIGDAGTGSLTQTGGTNTTDNLFVGSYSGGSGTYALSGGTLTVQNIYIQAANGTLEIGLASPDSYGEVNVLGTAILGGTLALSTDPNYKPKVGDSFLVMTFGSRTGDFAQFTRANLGGGLCFRKVYSANSLNLVVTKVQTTAPLELLLLD